MAVNTKAKNDIHALTTQEVLNQSQDQTFQVLVNEGLGYDGQTLQRVTADALATKITISGALTYVGIAAPGTAQSSALWQCKLIDTSVAGTTVITWADGDSNFDNVATDLTSLSYS